MRWLKRVRDGSRAADGRLKILHVLFTLQTGGAEYVALNLLERLDGHRYDRHVVSLTGEGDLADAFRRQGVQVHMLHKRSGLDPMLALRLLRLCRRLRPDIVHTHNATPWLYAVLAAKGSGASLYHTEHSNLFPHQRRLMRAERWLARWTDVIISDSEKVKRHLVERQGLPGRKITTILNGIDTERFSRPVDVAGVRRALGLNGSGPVIGTVGRLAEVKDHATLLEAFRRILEAMPQALLLIVGDGPLRAELEASARRLGIAGRVTFLGRRADVSQLLRAFDIFVLSSISEGLPLSVPEAMAAGVPVVATDVGALREVVSDPAFGVLVPPKSPERLAEAVLALLRDETRRGVISRAARERVQATFDVTRMVHDYETAYHHESLS